MTSADTNALEAALAEARTRLARALEALRPKHRGGEMEEWIGANAEVKRLERELGAANGDEVAIPYPWEPAWDAGAPMPHVLATNGRVFLVYYVRTPDPDWDGTYVDVIDPAEARELPLALVEVKGCYCHRFGGPNDEVFHGHPLAKRGLAGYGAYTVANSKWIAEHRTINSVHPMYDPKRWDERQHFFLAFHDDVFECIATAFAVEVVHGSFEDALKQVAARLIR